MSDHVGGCPTHRAGLLFWLPFAVTAALVLAAVLTVEFTTWYLAAGVLVVCALVALPIAIYHPACRAANRWNGYGHTEEDH